MLGNCSTMVKDGNKKKSAKSPFFKRNKMEAVSYGKKNWQES
jgi:hypothetical protein